MIMCKKPLKLTIENIIIQNNNKDTYILLNPTARVLKVNEIGKIIIELCNGNNAAEDIITQIVRQFGADYNQVRDDVIGFLEKLRICQLLPPE